MNFIERRLLDAIKVHLSQEILTAGQHEDYIRGWNDAIKHCKELLELFVASNLKNAEIVQFIKKYEDTENEIRRFYR